MDIKHPSLRSRSVTLGANALCWQSFQFLLGSLPLTVTAYALKQDFWKGSERRKLLRNSRVRVCEINFHEDPQLQHNDCCLCNNKKTNKKSTQHFNDYITERKLCHMQPASTIISMHQTLQEYHITSVVELELYSTDVCLKPTGMASNVLCCEWNMHSCVLSHTHNSVLWATSWLTISYLTARPPSVVTITLREACLPFMES